MVGGPVRVGGGEIGVNGDAEAFAVFGVEGEAELVDDGLRVDQGRVCRRDGAFADGEGVAVEVAQQHAAIADRHRLDRVGVHLADATGGDVGHRVGEPSQGAPRGAPPGGGG